MVTAAEVVKLEASWSSLDPSQPGIHQKVACLWQSCLVSEVAFYLEACCSSWGPQTATK